jgi:hypothetical protein
MQIDILNSEEIVDKLLRLPAKVRVKVEKDALYKANKLLIGTVRQNAPIKTSALKKSIISVIKKYRNDTRIIGIVGPDRNYTGNVILNQKDKSVFKRAKKGENYTIKPVKYAHLPDQGTVKRTTKSGANRGSVQEINFMQRSLDSKESQIRDIFINAINEAINDL